MFVSILIFFILLFVFKHKFCIIDTFSFDVGTDLEFQFEFAKY